MPTVLRVGPHRFFFYAREGTEPPHIHVQSAEKSAKFWPTPLALARSGGYDAHELRELRRLVEEHRDALEKAWHEFAARR